MSADDITLVLCVRSHAGNPWVLERLDWMAGHYTPCPPVLIVDFGSAPDYAAAITRLCEQRGYALVTVDDSGVFSLAQARNIAFQHTATDFVFFCDPDFFGERDLFQRLAETADALDMRSVVDIVLNLPAVHLPEAQTRQFEQAADAMARAALLRRWAWERNYTAIARRAESFIAPHSNVFMMHRDMFSMVGGYDANFRGHGSEDFEFLLRLAMHASHLPLPAAQELDLFGPVSEEFFKARPYAGFRRLFELMAQPTESLGLKVFHLWHARPQQTDWYKQKDRKRLRFREAITRYMDRPQALLGVDYLPRVRRMVCLCPDVALWPLFTPLRLVGFELLPVFPDDPKARAAALEALADGPDPAVAVFRPGNGDEAVFRKILDRARELGRQVVVIEPGMLPRSLLYGDAAGHELGHEAAFDPAAFNAEAFSSTELQGAESYVRALRQGGEPGDGADDIEVTLTKYLHLKADGRPWCFLPLQRGKDAAAAEPGATAYAAFVRDLPQLVARHPELRFVVMPVSGGRAMVWPEADNLIVADYRDNLHALLEMADVTLCHSSGVGLLSLLHEKPTITLGQTFYELPGCVWRAASAEEGLQAFLGRRVPAPKPELVWRMAAWWLYRKYSFLAVLEKPSASAEAKSRAEQTLAVTEFRWAGHVHRLGRLGSVLPFSWQCYAAARISAGIRSNAMLLRARQRWQERPAWVMRWPAVLVRWFK